MKEFRCRQFGRSQWLLRLVALCAVGSLGLTYVSTSGTMDWGVHTIGGILVQLEVAMIALITPSLGSSLISSESESGGWTLLQTTPLSIGKILRGKLLSALWTLVLILFATLPGYAVMIVIDPSQSQQITYVLFSLFLSAIFALMLSVAVSSFFQRTAHGTVETLLVVNPVAASLSVMGTPGFAHYHLVPANWWITGFASMGLLCVLYIQTRRLLRPR